MRFYSHLFHGIGDSIRFLGIDYTPSCAFNPKLASRVEILQSKCKGFTNVVFRCKEIYMYPSC